MYINVNWVKEDEELLESYEWLEHDDLERIFDLEVYLVDDKTLSDFIYGCMFIKDDIFCGKIFALSNHKVSVIVEIDTRGKLIYRGLSDIKGQQYILNLTKDLDETSIEYDLYDEAFNKEYGLTREERTKKQYVEDQIDELYVEDFERFVSICYNLGIDDSQGISMYIKLKKKIEHGYSFIHEMLYYKIIEQQ